MAKKNPEPQTIEGEVIESRSQALQVSPPANIAMLSPVVDLATAQRQLAEFQTFVASYLVEGTEGEGDFGTLPERSGNASINPALTNSLNSSVLLHVS